MPCRSSTERRWSRSEALQEQNVFRECFESGFDARNFHFTTRERKKNRKRTAGEWVKIRVGRTTQINLIFEIYALHPIAAAVAVARAARSIHKNVKLIFTSGGRVKVRQPRNGIRKGKIHELIKTR